MAAPPSLLPPGPWLMKLFLLIHHIFFVFVFVFALGAFAPGKLLSLSWGCMENTEPLPAQHAPKKKKKKIGDFDKGIFFL